MLKILIGGKSSTLLIFKVQTELGTRYAVGHCIKKVRQAADELGVHELYIKEVFAVELTEVYLIFRGLSTHELTAFFDNVIARSKFIYEEGVTKIALSNFSKWDSDGHY